MAELKPYPEYKDSGIPWMDKVPFNWDKHKISRIFKGIGSGSTPKSNNRSYYENGTIDWINTGDLNDEYLYKTKNKITEIALNENSALKIHPKNSLVIAMYGATIGKLAITKMSAATNQACCVLNEPINLDIKFMYYWFLTSRDDIIHLASGGGQPNISQNLIRNLFVFFPESQNEQKRIVAYLDKKTYKINSLISDKKRLIELLEEKRQAIITETVTKGLDPNVKMKDSGVEWIGEIPEHWEVVSLKYLTNHNLKYGANESAIDNKTDGWRYIRITDIDEKGNLKEDTRKTLPEEIAENYALSEGDILFARSGATVGKTYIHETDKKSCYAGYLIRYRANKNKLMPKFLYFYTQSNIYVNWIKEQLIQATIENVSAEKYANFKILLPTRHEQEEIVKSIQKNLNQNSRLINYLQEQIKKLKEYRESLIYEAVTGKIDLREYEINSSEYTTYEQVAESDEAYMKSD